MTTTPTKKKLKKKAETFRKRSYRLKKQLTLIRRRSSEQKTKKSDLKVAEEVIRTHLHGAACDLVLAQLKQGKCNRWSDNMKLYCLSLYYKSPSAYRFLRKTFKIPSVRTLQRMFSQFQVESGFSSSLTDMLKYRSHEMKELERFCNVSIDEVAIKEGLTYVGCEDRVLGFEDYGTFTGKKLGKQALVFMATGLFSHWKQPLGYFISSGSTPADTIRSLIMDCLHMMNQTGLIVKTIVFDQGTNNQKVVKDLQITAEKPYLLHEGKKVFVFFDPPHLLKSLRNNLHKHDFLVEGHLVSWQYIEQLYQLESASVTGLRLAPKLTHKHVRLPPFSKMKVKRAAQVLSHSVHAALMTYICTGKISKEALPTATFVKNVDSLFDVFNSNNVKDVKLFRCALKLKDRSPAFDFIDYMKQLLSNVEVLDLKTQPPCIKGWILSINALQQLCNEISLNFPFVSYLLTRKINQDPLENFFSSIRAKGGFSDNPDVKAFRSAYKQSMIKSCMSKSEFSNCESDANTLLIDIFNRVGDQSDPEEELEEKIFMSGPSSSVSSSSADVNLNENALYYVAGYAAKKYLDLHKCQSCAQHITVSTSVHGRHATFINYKTFSELLGTTHGLTFPSVKLYSHIQLCEQVFMSSFMDIMHVNKVCQRLIYRILSKADTTWCSSPCFNLEKITKIYITMRIHYAVKFFNRTLSSQPKHKRNGKLLKLQHI